MGEEEDPRLPQWTATTALWTVATQLREASFGTQAAAAREFRLVHTTVSRYERYDPEGGNGLKPPFGYLAALAARWEVRLVQEQAAAIPAVQQHLVRQLDGVRRRFYAAEYRAVVRTWTDLEQVAAAYRAERERSVSLAKAPPRPEVDMKAVGSAVGAGDTGPGEITEGDAPPSAVEPPPLSLYGWLDRVIYQPLKALMRGEGALLRELLILAGVGLGTWPLLSEVFALPADPTDRGALARGAFGLALCTTILPSLLGGGVLLLERERRPPWRAVQGRAAGALALMAYGGAGIGVWTALAVMAFLTLLTHYLGWTAPWIGVGLQGVTWLGVVTLGVVFARHAMDMYTRYREQVPDAPWLTGGEVLVMLVAPIFGIAEGLLLVSVYDLLLDWGLGLGILAAALLGCVIIGTPQLRATFWAVGAVILLVATVVGGAVVIQGGLPPRQPDAPTPSAVTPAVTDTARSLASASPAPATRLVTPVPCCSGQNGAEPGLITLKIWLDACRTDQLVALLAPGASPATIAQFLAETAGPDPGPVPLTTLARLLNRAAIQQANQTRVGVQLKYKLKDTVVEATAQLPTIGTAVTGALEQPVVNARLSGPVAVSGWARADNSCVASIEIWVDGRVLDTAQYGMARPDAGGNYGFQFTSPALATGMHHVQVRVVTSNGYSRFLPAPGTQVDTIPIEVPP